jgi:DNA-binding phage protein
VVLCHGQGNQRWADDYCSTWRGEQATAGRRHRRRCGAMESVQADEKVMITTREHSETIIARIKREPEFGRLLYVEAINSFLEGETAVGLSILRDLVNAEISFKELARQTGLGEKSLHRMLNCKGNPTAHNLGIILRSIAEDLKIKPRAQIA